MNREQSALWQRIETFEIDDPSASLPFSARLARENGWTRGFALRVVGEYRRFLFLATVTGHEVTPSDEVDEAWHLHLTYTRSYWDGLCREVLGKPLHHIPTRGGAADASRHLAQYEQTLASYREWFGRGAPTDVWPPAKARFDKSTEHVRMNRARAWIVPKPRLRRSRRAASWMAAAAIPPAILGVANPLDMAGQEFLVFYLAAIAIAIVVALVLRRALREDVSEPDTRPLEPQEVACLGHGVNGVLHSCLAGLVAEGKLAVVEKPPTKFGPITLGSATYHLRAATSPTTGANEIERVMLTVAGPDGADTANVLKSAKPLAEMVKSGLESRGLLESAASLGAAYWWPLVILGGVFALGFAKLGVGVWRDRPIIFLMICLAGLAIVVFFFAKRPFRTRRGEQLLEELKVRHEQLKSQRFDDLSSIAAADVMLMAGLFGLVTIEHPQIKQLHTALTPVPASDGGFAGGCGGDGGGGGGGCGGGCGGCGGD